MQDNQQPLYYNQQGQLVYQQTSIDQIPFLYNPPGKNNGYFISLIFSN